MKKYLVGSLVGAIIIFVWQGVSWMALGIHDSAMKYHPAQNEILNALSSTQEEAQYMLPSAPTQKEQIAMQKQMEGKPWASVIYHKSYNSDMTMRFIRGFLVDMFLVISLIYILTRGATPARIRVFSGSFAFGLAAWLWIMYMGHTWFDLPWSMITGYLIDSIVAWSLCGVWLAWWLNRPGNQAAPVSV